MSDIQIEALAQVRKPVSTIELRSPVSGYVLSRGVSPSQRFDRGTEFYRIADLSRVWVLADLFEDDARFVSPGTAARVTVRYVPTASIDVVVGDVLPQFDPVTRTFKIRLEAPNPGAVLRPDVIADVELSVRRPAAVTVPMDALVESGIRTVVFVDRGNGYFEPRRVETGWRFDDRVEIVRGLTPGERIVLSGNFLIDSESRMQAAAMGIASVTFLPHMCRGAASASARVD